jgi:serine/threonine protein kinase
VHCDLKPNNILINPQGKVKVIDLGQACAIGTKKTRIQGTPDYIAPEQEKLASKSDSQKNRDKGEESSSGGSIVGFAIFMVLAFAIWAMIPTFIAMALAWKIAANA